MKIEHYSPALWLLKNNFVNERGERLTFKPNHYFLYDIYKDLSQFQVIKKCAQVGVSVTMTMKTVYMAKYRGITTIYTMPSDSDVSEFVKTKADKIFLSNPVLMKGANIDNIQLKQIGDYFIYYKGTRSKTTAISTTADLLVHDEKDRSDLNIIEQYRSRITASKFKGIWELSNPSVTNVGVDVDWKKSDKKEWFITCRKCNTVQTLTWDENVDEIRGIYVCKKCGKELTDRERRIGKWIPTDPGKEISGYHISQMMAAWLTAKDLIREKQDRGIEYFNNFILGEPYHVGTAADFRQMITDAWSAKTLDQGPFILGVDIGIEKHYVLGGKNGIFKIGKVRSREELESIIERYNPTIIMDAGPERTWAEEFKKKYPKCHLVFYRKDKPKAPVVVWGGESGSKEDKKNWGYIWADRNRAIDAVIFDIQSGNVLFNITREDLEKYIKQWETLRRIEELTPLNTKTYKWETTTGMAHWVHATVYWWMAKNRAKKIVFIPDKGEKKDIIERTGEGFRMRSIKEVLEEQQNE